jgi:subtilisin family serine protease
MTQVKGKIKICQTKIGDFNIEQINGSPFYRRYNEFVRIFKSRMPNVDAERLFAQPMESEHKGVIDWFMLPSEGEVPVKISEIQAEEREKYFGIRNDIILNMQSVASGITTPNERIYFECALKYLQGEYVDDITYCYDDNITFAVWGMGMIKGREVSHVITDAVKDHRVYTVSYHIDGNGAIHGPNNILRRRGHVLSGAKDIPTITPAPRFKFVAWRPDAPHGKAVTGDVEYTAVCEHSDTYVVSFKTSKGGHLKGDVSIEKNLNDSLFESITPLPIPDNGFSFKGWSPAITDKTFVKGDTVFTAIFEKIAIPESPIAPSPSPVMHNVHFEAGKNGVLPNDYSDVIVEDGNYIPTNMIPLITTGGKFRFIGWDKQTNNPISEDTTFTAMYKKIPWYKRLWLWFKNSGCLKWILWLLLVLLLIALLLFFLHSCNGCTDSVHNGVVPVDTTKNAQGQYVDDNGYTKPITDDDGKLPEGDNVVSPVTDQDGEEPPIVKKPGRPDIIGNRLFLFLENENDNVDALAQDFKKAFPGDQYSIIGFDREVKSLVIQIPANERDHIRQIINSKISNHKFLVFDEDIYELNGYVNNNSEDPGWHLRAIHLQQGWRITKGSPNIKVAIIDDGIDATHPMFAQRIVNAYNVFTQNNHLSFGEGHGTHTAGLAVGSGEFFSKGISGVAPNCKIMPIQVFDNKRCPLSALVSGVMYAVHHGADVINMSVGPSFKGLDRLPIDEQEQIAKEQFSNVEQLWTRVCSIVAKKNSVLVFAAGNDNILSSIPPENRNTFSIVVSAVDKQLRATDFTDYGSFSDISAPGKDIFSSFPNNRFVSCDGTSMSAPIVTGTIALMKSIKKNLTIEQIKNVLYRTGAPVIGNIPPMVMVDNALIGVKRGDFSRSRGDEKHKSGVSDQYNNFGGPIDAAHDPRHVSGGEPNNGVGYDGGNTSVRRDRGASSAIAPVDNYDEIRAKIAEYKRKIRELEKLLPNNHRPVK